MNETTLYFLRNPDLEKQAGPGVRGLVVASAQAVVDMAMEVGFANEDELRGFTVETVVVRTTHVHELAKFIEERNKK